MTVRSYESFISAILTGILFLWLCCGLNYVLPNHGGSGLALPQNLMTWAVMALMALICLSPGLKHRYSVSSLPAGSGIILTGAVLWSLPLLWSPSQDWQLNALPRILGLWGMMGLFILLGRRISSSHSREHWLLILVMAAVLQAVHCGWQLISVAGLPQGRPYGSFQQVNVLASFIATGIVCALWLFINKSDRKVRAVSSTALIVLPALLTLLQSRAGQLGALSGIILLLLIARKAQKQRLLCPVLLMVFGYASGMLALHLITHYLPGTLLLLDKTDSTNHRLYMLRLTWQLIMQQPIVGNGYGSFEAIFGQLAQLIPPGLEADTLKYPHNELLYTWVEGGIVAVAGLLLMCVGVLHRLWRNGGMRMSAIALFLPLAVHMNLEYPLYQSTTHCLTLILLVVVCGDNEHLKPIADNKSWGRRSAALLAGCAAFAVLFFMLAGIQTQSRLTQIENQGLMPLAFNEEETVSGLLNPYSQYQRLDFDRHVALLLRFNLTRDPLTLNQFRLWGSNWLNTHNSPSVYGSLLQIARAQKLPEAATLCRQGHGLWPNDRQFSCVE